MQQQQEAIIHRYEKRIRKTRKVANQTEQKLKKQQSSLLHFKKELSRHVLKLQDLSSSGNPHAQKRLRNIRSKLVQLDKVVPYLGKYVNVNRQAEMQTIAILKESCTMELQKLSQGERENKDGIKVFNKRPEKSLLRNPTALPTQHDSHFDNASQPAAAIRDISSLTENPYASLTEIQKEAAVNGPKRSNYAELDFHTIRTIDNIRPPSVKYSEVKIDSLGMGKIQSEQFYSGSLPSVTVQRNISQEKDDGSICDATLTPENASLLNNLSSSNMNGNETPTAAPTERTHNSESSPPNPSHRIDSISKQPPPVSKKPSSWQSPSHTVFEHSDGSQKHGNPDEQVVSSSVSINTVLFGGTTSVMDRIKVI